MKPQFALDLTHTSIRLLHLAGPDEVELGFVTLDDPDFDARVHDLYRIAEERAKGRVRSLLLLPNSEILYTRVHTGPGDREARAKAVAEALVGMTPYSLDELRFDWRVDGDEAIVAAVANLTLEEAETFAVARGFNPLGFSARPENGAFKGTPDFGETELAKARKAGAPWPDRPEPPAPPAPPVTEPPVAEEEPRPETPADDAPVAEAPADPPAPVTADDQPETPVTAPEPNAPTAPDDPAPELDLFPVTPGRTTRPTPRPATTRLPPGCRKSPIRLPFPTPRRCPRPPFRRPPRPRLPRSLRRLPRPWPPASPGANRHRVRRDRPRETGGRGHGRYGHARTQARRRAGGARQGAQGRGPTRRPIRPRRRPPRRSRLRPSARAGAAP